VGKLRINTWQRGAKTPTATTAKPQSERHGQKRQPDTIGISIGTNTGPKGLENAIASALVGSAL
jgi:hypothetical protein